MIEKLETSTIQSWEYVDRNGDLITTYHKINIIPTNKEIADKINEIIDFLNDRLK